MEKGGVYEFYGVFDFVGDLFIDSCSGSGSSIDMAHLGKADIKRSTETLYEDNKSMASTRNTNGTNTRGDIFQYSVLD